MGPPGPPKVMKTLNCSPARQQGDRSVQAVTWNQQFWTGVFNGAGARAPRVSKRSLANMKLHDPRRT
jgi:hypothetical protein